MKRNSGSITGEMSEWGSACLLAASDEIYFGYFRASPIFVTVIEGTPRLGGQLLAKRLEDNSIFIASSEDIAKSDLYGSPQKTFPITTSTGVTNVSPTTLRYANNCINILGLFGEEVLTKPIIEIGGGYGGECKVFNDIAQNIFEKHISLNWTIYDLATSTNLIRKWLRLFGYTAQFTSLSGGILKNSTDFMVISNGAFSEMNGELLENYFEKIIKPARYGYFITNFETHSAPYGGWTTKMFLERLVAAGKVDAAVLPSHKYLSWTDSGNSTLVCFGMGINRPKINSKGDPLKYKLISKISEVELVLREFILRSSLIDYFSRIASPLLLKIFFKDKYRNLY